MKTLSNLEKTYLASDESGSFAPIHPTGIHHAEIQCDDGFTVVFQNNGVNPDFQDFSPDMYMA